MRSVTPNSRTASLAESATLAISAQAAKLRSEGRNVISLSAGEPDFPTPEAIAEAGIQAIREGRTRYTAASGLPKLRQAAAGWFQNCYGLTYAPNEVMVTSGVKAALHMALMSLVEPGDRVLLLAPYWVSYPSLVHVAGGEPVILPATPDQGFLHSPEQIAEAAKTTGARGIIINYPSNPSGAVPDKELVQGIHDVAEAAGMWILSDEIYGSLVYDDCEHISPASFDAEHDRVVVVNGGTKSHSFTGWRIGFLAGHADMIAAAGRLQSQVIGNSCTISQEAAMEICCGDYTEELAARKSAFDQRRRFLVEQINAIDGLSAELPKGAFYVMANASEICSRLDTDDIGVASRILHDHLVATVPGSPFGAPGFLRLSYAVSMEELEIATQRLSEFACSVEIKG